jgi:hypothetical protein
LSPQHKQDQQKNPANDGLFARHATNLACPEMRSLALIFSEKALC